MKRWFIVTAVLLAGILLTFAAPPVLAVPGDMADPADPTANAAGEPGEDFGPIMVRGRVLEILSEETVEREYVQSARRQVLRVRVDSGVYAGEVFEIVNEGTGSPIYDIYPRRGDRVLLAVEDNPEGGVSVYLADRLREPAVYLLVALFAVFLIAVGGIKGIKALFSLAVTILLVALVLLPALLRGADPIFTTILVAMAATCITLAVVSGLNRKTLAALVGITAGVGLAGALAVAAGRWAHLTGFSTEESVLLLYLPQEVHFDVQGLLFAGIMLGSLGAIMDVGMSIASAVDEVFRANPSYSARALFKAGMNVGRDVMGTMTNTLILAYTGSSIPLLLLLLAYRHSYLKVLNFDFIASECVRALSGSIGLVAAIPLTAATAALFLGVRDGVHGEAGDGVYGGAPDGVHGGRPVAARSRRTAQKNRGFNLFDD